MKLFVAFYILAQFFAKTNSLKCSVCDSIYESTDSACQLKDCDEYAKEWLEFEDKFSSKIEKLNSSLSVYYHNMTKLENSLKKKSAYENINDGSKFFDTCISKFGVHDGKRVKMKACGRKKWDSCKNGSDREIFESCSTCETDYCNTLQCYSCGGRFDGDITHITPCKDTIQNFCYGDYSKCFAATGVKNGEKVEYRGCTYNNETQIAKKKFEEESLSYYFCEKSLCNNESSKSAEVADQKCDDESCKNINRYKKDSDSEDKEGDEYLRCRVCEGVAIDAPCRDTSCKDHLKSTGTNHKYKCVSANGTINGKKMKYKTCTIVGSSLCDDLKKKGYESCSTCHEEDCTQLYCHECERDVLEMSNFMTMFTNCDQLTPKGCDSYEDTARCYSAKTKINGNDVVWKGCMEKEKVTNFTNFLKYYGFSSYFCDEYLCNQKA